MNFLSGLLRRTSSIGSTPKISNMAQKSSVNGFRNVTQLFKNEETLEINRQFHLDTSKGHLNRFKAYASNLPITAKQISTREFFTKDPVIHQEPAVKIYPMKILPSNANIGLVTWERLQQNKPSHTKISDINFSIDANDSDSEVTIITTNGASSTQSPLSSTYSSPAGSTYSSRDSSPQVSSNRKSTDIDNDDFWLDDMDADDDTVIDLLDDAETAQLIVEKSLDLPLINAPFNPEFEYKLYNAQFKRDLSLLTEQILQLTLPQYAAKFNLTPVEINKMREIVTDVLANQVKLAAKETVKIRIREEIKPKYIKEIRAAGSNTRKVKNLKNSLAQAIKDTYKKIDLKDVELSLHEILFGQLENKKNKDNNLEHKDNLSEMTSEIEKQMKKLLDKHSNADEIISGLNNHIKNVCIHSKSVVYREKLVGFNQLYSQYDELLEDTKSVAVLYDKMNDSTITKQESKKIYGEIQGFNKRANALRKEIENINSNDRIVFNSLRDAGHQLTVRVIEENLLGLEKASKERSMQALYDKMIRLDSQFKQELENHCVANQKSSDSTEVRAEFLNIQELSTDFKNWAETYLAYQKKTTGVSKDRATAFLERQKKAAVLSEVKGIIEFWNIKF